MHVEYKEAFISRQFNARNNRNRSCRQTNFILVHYSISLKKISHWLYSSIREKRVNKILHF
jgi:hypothetical protein